VVALLLHTLVEPLTLMVNVFTTATVATAVLLAGQPFVPVPVAEYVVVTTGATTGEPLE
jgi:hypothetical protein